MPSFLNTLRIIVAVLPAVVELVKALERAIPFPRVGPEKLELLRQLISDVYASLEEGAKKGVSLEGVLSAVAAIAARFVQIFNRLGWPAAAS